MDERRFCASKVSGAHFAPPGERNHPNRLYWNQLYTELNNGGRAAFLHDMLKRDLDGWHPREDVPITEAMGEQKLHGLKEVGRWWFEILREGEPFPLLPDFEDGHWSKQALQASPAEVTAAYCEWLHYKNPHANVSSKWLLEELKKWGWEGGGNEYRKPTKDRERYWLVPRLDHARHLFAARLGTDPFVD